MIQDEFKFYKPCKLLQLVLNLYKPEIYKLSDYSKLWIDEKFYPYGNEFMIVK